MNTEDQRRLTEYEEAEQRAEVARCHARELLRQKNELTKEIARAEEWARLAQTAADNLRGHLTADGLLKPGRTLQGQARAIAATPNPPAAPPIKAPPASDVLFHVPQVWEDKPEGCFMTPPPIRWESVELQWGAELPPREDGR